MFYGLVSVPAIVVYAVVTDGIKGGREYDILMIIFWSGVLSFGIGFLWPDGGDKYSGNDRPDISRELKIKFCNEIGKSVHKQIRDTVEVKGQAFADPREVVFFYAYLDQLVFSYFEYHLSDTLRLITDDYDYKKHICDGVLPKRAWDYYTRGHGISELSDVADFDVEAILSMGRAAGWADANDGLHKFYRLAKFLRGEDLLLAFELDQAIKDKTAVID
ncbi:hypothetical protein [Shewanella sp.]|uniref:hypothetical protein n=1 Tax=Shewanella sp. TaxID=50422 RepID=UPI00404798EA